MSRVCGRVPALSIPAGRTECRLTLNTYSVVERVNAGFAGTMAVATPETTAFDVVRFFSAAGHWSNVATVLSELAEKLDSQRLVSVAPHVRPPDVQRLGYLLTVGREGKIAEPLAAWLTTRRTTVVRLRTDRPTGAAEIDPRWRLCTSCSSNPQATIPRTSISCSVMPGR